MIFIHFLAPIALWLLFVKGDNTAGAVDDVMLRNILSINLTVADLKTELCGLKERLNRIERMHGLAPSTDVHTVDSAALDQFQTVMMKQLFDKRLTDDNSEVPESFNVTYQAFLTEKLLCDNGWTRFQEQCYFFSQNKLSWDEANTTCAAMNGRLAIADNKYISMFIRADTNRFVRYWVGGRKEGKTWKWAGTGNALEYTAWCPEQPDGNGTLCMSFLKLNPPTCYWTDRKCKYRQGYICQRPVENLRGTGNG